MSSITTRVAKGSPLTYTEVDGNFTNLNTDKLDTAGIAAGTAASPTIKFTGDTNTGIYSPGADQLALATAGTGRLFIDSSGRVGIGTTSPGTVLAINDPGTGLGFTNAASGNFNLGLLGGTGSNEAYIFQRANGSLLFGTNNTERARIDSSGNWFLGNTGTSSPSSGFDAYIGFDSAGASAMAIGHVNGSATGTRYFSFVYNSTQIGSITQNGTTAVAYNTTSDYRLKENVTPAPDGITRLKQLKPSRFNFIAEPDRSVDGFIAHEVQAVVPECVTGEKDAVDDDGNPVYQGIDQSKLVPLLTAALQEAIGRIETLEAEVSALKGAPTCSSGLPWAS